MRAVVFLFVLALSTALGFYSPVGFAVTAILLIFEVLCAAANWLDKSEISAKVQTKSSEIYENVFVNLNVFVSNRTYMKIVIENVLTHEKSVQKITLLPDESRQATLTFPVKSDSYGRLIFTAQQVKRYDLLGITYKYMKLRIDGHIDFLPDYNSESLQSYESLSFPALKKRISATTSKSVTGELDGNREYVIGDDLKRVNHKLSCRFGKLYIKEYSTEKASEICLIPDFRNCTPIESAEVAADACRWSRQMFEKGIQHTVAVLKYDGEFFIRNVTTAADFAAAESAILAAETEMTNETLSLICKKIGANYHIQTVALRKE